MAETEYIRGKLEERNGALTARPAARFAYRGNDVWAHRSGRTYQPSTMEMMGSAQPDYSSPVTGNGGMGNLSRLVGGKHIRRARGAGRSRSASPCGAGLMMSPEEAKHLVMMDYRGGSHPYLTKSGRVRAPFRGSGIWDDIKGVAKTALNEITNPQSTLRGTLAPVVAMGATLAGKPDLARAASAISSGQWGDLASSAQGAFNAYQKSQGLKKGAQQLGELASGLKGKPSSSAGPKPGSFMSDMPQMLELEDKKKTYNWSKPGSKPRAVKDSNGYPLAIEDKPRPRPLAIEDKQRPLAIEDASSLDLADMKVQKAFNNMSKTLGLRRPPGSYEVGGARRRRRGGAGTPDYATLMALQHGARAQGSGFLGDLFSGVVGTVKKASPLLKMVPGWGRAIGTVADFLPDDIGQGRPRKARRSNRHAQMVGQVMRERGVSLAEASKIVKAEGLA